MHFIRGDWQTGEQALAAELRQALSTGKPIVWLVSGGSNIASSVRVMRQLPADRLQRLTVMPVDERYGTIGHDDSNVTQLLAAGFEPGTATFLGVLQPGLDFLATAQAYQEHVATVFAQAGVIIIAQLGMGSDGHVAGILPHSPATEPTEQLAVAYESHPYRRITLTFAALRQVNTVYLFAFGAEKLSAVTNLAMHNLSFEEQPAQILKELFNVYVYNDQVGN